MPQNPSEKLQEILEHLRAHQKKIIYFGLVSLLLGLVIGILKPKQYIAETTFILKNHLFADRSYLFSKDMRYINYYADEDDIERLKSLIDADSVMDVLIRDFNLVQYYKVDTLQKPKALRVLKKDILNRIKIYRTPEKNGVLAFRDANADTAALLANQYLSLIEKTLRKNFNSVRQDVRNALLTKIAEEDNNLAAITDSLSILRDYYGIYDIINPTRGNMIMNAHVVNNGHPEFAKGIELIQNLESVKDRLVADRSDHMSLANQYTYKGSQDDLSLVQIIKTAEAPLKPFGLGPISIALFSGALGVLFGILFFLLKFRLLQTKTNLK